MSERRYRVLVCRGPECGEKRNARAVYKTLDKLIADAGVADRVELDWQSCFGRCTQGPNVLVREVSATRGRQSLFAPPAPVLGARTALYNEIDDVTARDIVAGHLLGDQVQGQLVRRPVPTQSRPASADSKTDPVPDPESEPKPS